MLIATTKSLVYRLPDRLQRFLYWRMRRLLYLRSASSFRKNWSAFERMEEHERRQWLLDKVRGVVLHAQTTNPFYQSYYRENHFDARDLRSFDDLLHIPVVTKNILRSAGPDWLQPHNCRAFANTGGTSGSPLRFCAGKRLWAKEAFHIEKVWERIGCSSRNARAVFRGVNVGHAPWIYRPQDDAYYVNTYRSYAETADALRQLFMTRDIQFLHGYPSAIYQFALSCLDAKLVDLRQAVSRCLRGVLLGSEYPAPQYRTVIEDVFQVRTISWYGHSEMTVLAAETDHEGMYEPLHTYGYCEAVPAELGTHSLVGTSFDNLSSPFIRYDTGDRIEPVRQDKGLLLSFRIAAGRVGEFVMDRNGSPISLTALIFGRHHKAFDRADFVQISQERPGMATIHVTTRDTVSNTELARWFDTGDVAIDFRFRNRRSPWRTSQGKVALLIPADASG
jgi:phenylacetate-CoA ligase